MNRKSARNQKRELRNQITRLTQQVTTLQLELTRTKHYEAELDKVVCAIESICYYSGALPAKELSMGYEGQEIYRITHRHKGELKCIDLHKLGVYLEVNRDKLETAIHLKFKGNHAAYLLTKNVLDNLPLELLVEQVSRDLITCLRSNKL